MSTETPKRPSSKKSAPTFYTVPKFSSDYIKNLSALLNRDHGKIPVTFNAALQGAGGLAMVQRWYTLKTVDPVLESQIAAWMALVLGSHEQTQESASPQQSNTASIKCLPRSFIGLASLLPAEVQTGIFTSVMEAVSPVSSKELAYDPYKGAYKDLKGACRSTVMREQVHLIVAELLSLSCADLHTKMLNCSPASGATDMGTLTGAHIARATNICNVALVPKVLLALDRLSCALAGDPSAPSAKSDFAQLKLRLERASKALT